MQTDLNGAGACEETNPGLIWFSEECMNNGAPLETYIEHAEQLGDPELATFFRRALAHSRRMSLGDPRRPSRRTRNATLSSARRS